MSKFFKLIGLILLTASFNSTSFSNENLRARESEAEKAKVLINDLCSLNDEGLKEKVSRKELYSALTKLIQGATEDFKTKLLNSNDPIKALNEINDAEIKLPKNSTVLIQLMKSILDFFIKL